MQQHTSGEMSVIPNCDKLWCKTLTFSDRSTSSDGRASETPAFRFMGDANSSTLFFFSW
jgi:hypothetical protein